PHHDLEVVPELLGDLDQPAGVIQRGGRVVHRAGADHREQAVVAAGEDVGDLVPVAGDQLRAARAQRELAEHVVRAGDLEEATDAPVRRLGCCRDLRRVHVRVPFLVVGTWCNPVPSSMTKGSDLLVTALGSGWMRANAAPYRLRPEP